MNKATFKHLFTGKTVTVFNPRDCKAIIHGTATNKDHPAGVDCAFLLLDGIAQPVPVQETEEEILTKLGLNQEKPTNAE